ncbi:MAG: NIPSNAP family containing protein [Acidimicrobiales bacterium]
MNDRVYIHEFIDIRGHHRASYMHHMTANWSPTAQVERAQLCYGVWALLGSTGGWPRTVNMWEHTGWDGLAASFSVETVGKGAQDPKLEKWWAMAADFRRGGFDRIMIPAPWTRTIAELCADGVRGDAYAHELVKVRAGASAELLERANEGASPLLGRYGWQLIGAFRTAMVADDEALLLWAIPTWAQWAAGEQADFSDGDLRAWRSGLRDMVINWHRVLLIDAPLSPFRTGRQPSRDDRTDWED